MIVERLLAVAAVFGELREDFPFPLRLQHGKAGSPLAQAR
jgi:hypothetical protein